MSFAEILQKFMNTYHLSPAHVAALMGVKPPTVKNWVSGKTVPSYRKQNEIRLLERKYKEQELSIINKIVVV